MVTTIVIIIVVILAVIVALPIIVGSFLHGWRNSDSEYFHYPDEAMVLKYVIQHDSPHGGYWNDFVYYPWYSWAAYAKMLRDRKRLLKIHRLYFLLTLSPIWGYFFYLAGRFSNKAWEVI